MTNLTEQYINGNLQDGEEYYIENKDGEVSTMHLYNDTVHWHSFKVKKLKVLEKVPSYEEWRDIKDDLATCDKDLNNVCEQKEELYEENEQLKELLKECKLAIFDYPPYDLASDKIRLQIKINQVLGEE